MLKAIVCVCVHVRRVINHFRRHTLLLFTDNAHITHASLRLKNCMGQCMLGCTTWMNRQFDVKRLLLLHKWPEFSTTSLSHGLKGLTLLAVG